LRVVGLHGDVVVATSRVWQTSCTLVRHTQSASRSGTGGEEAFCIDSPVLPDELEVLPRVAETAGFGIVGLLCTHADWDHVLGGFAFPDAPLGCSEGSAQALHDRPGAQQRDLRDFDERFYVERPQPLRLPSPQPLPVPGRCSIGEAELELHPATGHTGDGMAIWVPWAGVLICGDYLSPVEIPMISATGSLDAYLATLDRLEPLVEGATWIVPGHGPPMDPGQAGAVLREDRAYLQALRDRGPDAPLPLARRTGEQKRAHAANVKRLS
jgi:glyoxylase-like metal-dependent hydrolase (beta-lactamase superfamily II)